MLLRVLANWGLIDRAFKLGGGLFGTIIVFVLLWWILGHFGIFS